MPTFEELAKDIQRRRKIADTWKDRLNTHIAFGVIDSQAAFCRILKMDEPYFCKLCNGTRTPRQDLIDRVEKAFEKAQARKK